MFSQKHNTTKGMIAAVILLAGFAVFRAWSKAQSHVDPPVHRVNYEMGESLELDDLNPEELDAMLKFMDEKGLPREINGKGLTPPAK